MKVVTFGEIMMRLNPLGYWRIQQAREFRVSYAGSEANVAGSLANLGEQAVFVSSVPDNPLGQCAVNRLREYGVDTRHVCQQGSRLGIYVVEKGASQPPSKVIYDRKGAAITEATLDTYPWEKIFEEADWFHFSGITPALGGMLPEICAKACMEAKRQGMTVSCDINYRKNLWSREEANRVMTGLMEHVDVLIGNEEDAADVFQISASGTDVSRGKINREGYCQVAEELVKCFRLKRVAFTLRESESASRNHWSGILYENGAAFYAPGYTIELVDRVGGGDSFSGALIYALGNKYSPQDAIDFAVAASCLKQTMEEDFNLVSVDEIRSVAEGNVSGRVQR